MKTVVYISLMPLTEKVARDWYISYLVDNGVAVEFWDIAGLLFPGVKFQEPLGCNYLRNITDYDCLERLLAGRDIANTSFVVLCSYEGRFNRLFRTLTHYNCSLFFFEWGNFPIKSRSGLIDRIGRLVRHPGKFAVSLQDRLKRAFAKRFHLVKPYDVVFAAGAVSMGMHPRAGKHVAVNLCDYDNFLNARNESSLLSASKYAVFLDINLAFQSDLKIIGWDVVDPQAYADSLNRLFRLLEQQYGLEIVIAAHPKADYSEGYFEGRKVLKGLTPELVRDAEFVISHHSTSISYAVLNRKPLLFIYTNEMKKIYADTVVAYIHDFAEYLAQPVINVDELSNAARITMIEPDPERYDLYKYNYLTSKESEGRLNRDIVLAELTA